MITTIHPGLFTTVQDDGRWGYQAFGMPVAGAMDRYAYRSANLLVGNKLSAAVLEMTLKGGHFRFERECYVAICGADMQAMLNGIRMPNWSSFRAAAGSELVFDFAVNGCRAYMAVYGGIDVPMVLGSRSTYTRAAVGGIDGRALREGDVLPIGQATEQLKMTKVLPAQYIPCYDDRIELRVLLGPQEDHFTATGISTLFSNPYTISPEADRMGYRLDGAAIEHKGKADIISDALCQGAIQVPGHGMPIIMMADRQTTGGYAKIGTVIGPDLRLLAQAKPGDTVTFRSCSEAEAEMALLAEQDAYRQMAAAMLDNEIQTAAGPVRHFKMTINNQVFHVNIREVE